MSPQHDAVISNASGAAVRADLNNALAALITNSSGATSPATTYAFQFWADTTTSQLKIRNAANSAWITLMELDGTMLMEDGTAAAPGLSFASDTDTGLFRPAANQLGIATSGVERVEFGTTEVVFNDSGADVDLRVEGDAEANLLKVDAGNDRIGIAESAPGTLVEIGSTAPYVTLKNSTEEDTDGGRESRLIFEGEQSGGEISTLAQIEVSHDGTADDEKGKLVISTNDGSDGASPTAAVTIDSSGQVGIGTSSATEKLEVSGSINTVGPSADFDTGASRVFVDYVTSGLGRIGTTNGSASTAIDLAFFTCASGGGSTEKLRIKNDGGLTFNGDTAQANALDDYEEGTWTPVYKTRDTSNVLHALSGSAYSRQSAHYLKVGRLIHVRCRLSLSTKGTATTGHVNIAGLPYPVNTVSEGWNAIALGFASNWTTYAPQAALAVPGGSEIQLYANGGADSRSDMSGAINDTYLSNTADIIVAGTYMTN